WFSILSSASLSHCNRRSSSGHTPRVRGMEEFLILLTVRRGILWSYVKLSSGSLDEKNADKRRHILMRLNRLTFQHIHWPRSHQITTGNPRRAARHRVISSNLETFWGARTESCSWILRENGI